MVNSLVVGTLMGMGADVVNIGWSFGAFVSTSATKPVIEFSLLEDNSANSFNVSNATHAPSIKLFISFFVIFLTI